MDLWGTYQWLDRSPRRRNELMVQGEMRMRIGVIGAGYMGATLARRLAELGHQVSIANSRGAESLTALAGGIGATPVSVVNAAHAGEIAIISIPTRAVADLPSP
jgi:predicted dinucleotide-binding enzyme